MIGPHQSTSCQIRAQDSAVGGLVYQPANGSQTKTHRPRGQAARFEVNAIPENDRPAEGEPGLRAVPVHELVNCVPVAALGVNRTEAVQNRRFRLVQVRQPKNRFRPGVGPFRGFSLASLAVLPGHTTMLNAQWRPGSPLTDRNAENNNWSRASR